MILITIMTWISWVPRVKGEPFGTQFPESLREILVENGTLNPDYTPNAATARKLGWTLEDVKDSPKDLASNHDPERMENFQAKLRDKRKEGKPLSEKERRSLKTQARAEKPSKVSLRLTDGIKTEQPEKIRPSPALPR